MSGPLAPPAPPGVVRSQLILATGLAATASILAAWLLFWLIFCQTHLRLLAFASDSTDGTLPLTLTFGRADARDATAPEQGAGELRPLPTADSRDLLASVRAYLEERRGQSSVVLITAPGLASFGAEATEVVLPPVDLLRHVVRDEALRGVSLRDLIAAFRAASGQRLLILDLGRSRADTDAGAFGDDVMAEVARLAPPAGERTGFAILCASAPGQWTWSSDADGRSVFGHFVAEGLRRGGEVGTFLRVVPAQVAAWVATHRAGAVQTPVVLGDQSLKFTLPVRKDRPSAEPDPRQGDQARRIREGLMRHYQHHARYERSGLPGLDPTAWRDYRHAWLAAERLFRAGQMAACGQRLAEADAREAPFRATAEHDWPSLTLNLQVTIDPDRLAPLTALRDSLAGSTPAADLTALDRYAESQPRRFGRVFDAALRASGGKPDPARDPLNPTAARLRILAERAATLAPGGHPGVDLWVDRAGAKRREALDRLHSTAPSGPIAPLMAEAEADYGHALALAEAVNLVDRVVTDLPFLGAWAVRRGQFHHERDRYREVARQTQNLARQLDLGRRDPSVLNPAQIATDAATLAGTFDALRKPFDRAAEAALLATSWRDIDDVLAVPSIRPDLRATLVDRAIDPSLNVALRPPATDPKAGAGPSVALELAKQSIGGSGLTVNDLGRQGLNALTDPARGWDPGAPSPEVRPDPTFAQYQGDLAVLEGCLLTLGGLADRASLEPLLHPPAVPSGIARAARVARARLLTQFPAPSTDDPIALTQFERARLVLPAPEVGAGSSPNAVGDPGAARWSRFLVRLADLLREDGDGELARRYLAALPEPERGTEATRRVAAGIDALAQPIPLRAEPGGPIALAGGPPATITLGATAPSRFPRGQAALLLGSPSQVRVRAVEPAALIDLAPGSPATRRVEVRRAEALADTASQATLAPVLVFRGRRIDAEPVALDLPVVRSDFRVRFVTPAVPGHRSEMARKYHIDARQIVDQFERDPHTYTFYQGARTTLEALVKYAPASEGAPATRRIVAAATCEGQGVLVHRKGAKAPGAAVEIRAGEEIPFEIAPIDTSDPRFRPHPDGSEFRFEVQEPASDPADGPTVALATTVRFREVDPAMFFAVAARRISPTEVAVSVRRGGDDPIALVVGAAVQVTGGAPLLEAITYEVNTRLGQEVAERRASGVRTDDRAILPRGETAVFRFAVNPQEPLSIRAVLTNDAGPPWPLTKQEIRIPPVLAAPPSPAPAQQPLPASPTSAPGLLPASPTPVPGLPAPNP